MSSENNTPSSESVSDQIPSLSGVDNELENEESPNKCKVKRIASICKRPESTDSTEKLIENLNNLTPANQDEILNMARNALSIIQNNRTDFHLDCILNYIAGFYVFRNMSYNEKLNVALVSVMDIYQDEVIIIDKNEMFCGLYMVMSGRVMYTQDNTEADSYLEVGDSFGIPIRLFGSLDLHSEGVFKVDSYPCELLKIRKDEYLKYLESVEKITSGDDYEFGEASYDGNIVTSATKEKLIELLFDECYLYYEPTFPIDFFLTYQLTIKDREIIIEKLSDFFKNNILKEMATSVVVTWLLYCPEDFECEYMQDFLSFVIDCMKDKSLYHITEKLINTLYKQSFAYEYNFTFPCECTFPLTIKYRFAPHPINKLVLEPYIIEISEKSSASECGLEIGDEIIFINDYSVTDINISQFKQIILSQSTFIIIVKRCKLKFKYYENTLEELDVSLQTRQNVFVNSTTKLDTLTSLGTFKRSTLFKAFGSRISRKSKNTHLDTLDTPKQEDEGSITSLETNDMPSNKTIKYSQVVKHWCQFTSTNELNESLNTNNCSHFIIKLYNCTHEFRYYTVSRLDNCKKIVYETKTTIPMRKSSVSSDKTSALPDHDLYLFISKISELGTKFSRLNDGLNNLPKINEQAFRIYMARSSAEIKISKEIENEMRNEKSIELLKLDDHIIAVLLTFTDFYYYTKISSKEYLADFIKDRTNNQDNLKFFEERCNNEVMWVIMEVLHESNIKQRVKIISKFIKIAQYCLDLGNFNGFFSIIGGLENSLISRLKTTWELVSQKNMKNFETMKSLCSPDNNSTAYREWFIRYSMNKERSKSSFIIPHIPLLKKDLTFIFDSTKSSNRLINVRKIRLFCKELRKVFYYKNDDFCLDNAFQFKQNYSCTILTKPSLTISPYDKDGKRIMLSNISSTILSFISLEKLSKQNDTFTFSSNYDKRFHDEIIMINRVKNYLSKIDILNPQIEQLKARSYEYDIPPKFILDNLSRTTTNDSDSVQTLRNSVFSSSASMPTSINSSEKSTEPPSQVEHDECELLGTLV